tara:strand:- start:428 stop:553 length:126 start_codon:yes stop_codon:yes gene_type:complete
MSKFVSLDSYPHYTKEELRKKFKEQGYNPKYSGKEGGFYLY